MIQALCHIEKYCSSKAFAHYMQTSGVREYKHFAKLPADYVPSIPDAAMALHESIGKRACQEIGFSCDVSGLVIADGIAIGRSKLAQGKATKGITIAMWLEDVGQLGFVTKHVRDELDEALWPGWFDTNVTHLISPELARKNNQRAIAEYQQRSSARRIPGWFERLKYHFSNFRIRRHYREIKKRRDMERPPTFDVLTNFPGTPVI